MVRSFTRVAVQWLIASATLSAQCVWAQPTFRKVADTGTAIPNGAGNFTSFAEFSSGAPTIDDGEVAFFGVGSGSQEGVYLETEGMLVALVDRNSIYPDGDNIGTFSNINLPLAISAGRVKFNGSGNFGQGGIFTAAVGAINPLVDTATAHSNGLGNYGIFGNTALDNGQGVFFGGNNSDTGYYLRFLTGGPITTIAERLDIMPGSASDQFFGFGRPDLEGGVVAFTGSGGATLGRRGVYVHSGGSLSALYDSTMTEIPGGTGNFVSFSSVSLSGGKVLFYGEGDTEQGFYTNLSGELEVVADLNTPAPGGGTFDNNGFIFGALDGDGIALWSYLAGGGNGIYTNLPGSLDKVIATGDMLDDKTVSDLDFSPEGLSGQQIVFRAIFGDGTSGIYVASYDAPNGPGDFDGDGFVDGEDLAAWTASFGTADSATVVQGDADGDHDVDGADFLVWQGYFDPMNLSQSATSPIPEPVSIFLAVCGLAPCCIQIRSRRDVK